MVAAGIVTYNPQPEIFEKCLYSIKKQVDKVYIYDNGSDNSEILNKYLNQDGNVKVWFNSKNVGIAKALNELCTLAKDDGYKWIVTMDQDSICENQMISLLMNYSSDKKNGIIAPRVEFRVNEKLIHETKNKENEVERIDACITSGSLTNLDAWENIGGFDEWMFIDHVDNEFCAHLRVEGYYILRVNSAVLFQRAGEMKYVTFFGKKILLPYYSELRNYYICRNTVYFIKKYRKKLPMKKELLSFVYSQCIKFLLEKNRFRTIKSSVKGIRDGLRT